jgi:hypothetical protein
MLTNGSTAIDFGVPLARAAVAPDAPPDAVATPAGQRRAESI